MAGENDSAAIPTAPAIDQKRLRVDLTGQVAVVTGARLLPMVRLLPSWLAVPTNLLR